MSPSLSRYATAGAETYFLNRLDPDARSREVFSFHKPETIADWMERADQQPKSPTVRAGLRPLPPLEPNGLRLAQLDALSGLEKALGADRPRSLIQMAIGAGYAEPRSRSFCRTSCVREHGAHTWRASRAVTSTLCPVA
ncbi:hypothetical protein CP973_09860 [Streptomyces albofaciens JCM 4342]|nr:hypothetical protein CP973_09860 [Streptomyces albofaciens JCM 4342]